MKRIIIAFFCIVFAVSLSAQKRKGLAPTPPMGWNTWNTFACEINEDLIKGMADALVSSGMKDAGYVYLVIDDCWHGGRDSLGYIYPDAEKFPSGMKALADYVHSKGLKLGIYSDAGAETCAGYPGSRGHEYQDALTYAGWGIDFLKYDWCNTDSLNAYWAYTTMRDALYKTGKDILFSLCEWGDNDPWLWAEDIGHMWRTSGDISPCYDCEEPHDGWSSWGVMKIVYMRDSIRKYAGPDHWNDFDMMEVGNGMTQAEDRTHFAMWCMLASPLIAGNDIRSMSEETKQILTNKAAIAVNQDKLGIQTFRHSAEDSLEIWVKPLENDEWAVCFLNRSKDTKKVSFDWSKQVFEDKIFDKKVDLSKVKYQIEDIYGGKTLGTTKKKLEVEITSHDVLFVRLTK